jgi:hypothetical protein
MLALDQVLREHWSGLTTFVLRQAGRRWSAQVELRSRDLTYYVDPKRGSLGFWDVGPWVYP